MFKLEQKHQKYANMFFGRRWSARAISRVTGADLRVRYASASNPPYANPGYATVLGNR